jgi:hypothetical protein
MLALCLRALSKLSSEASRRFLIGDERDNSAKLLEPAILDADFSRTNMPAGCLSGEVVRYHLLSHPTTSSGTDTNVVALLDTMFPVTTPASSSTR